MEQTVLRPKPMPGRTKGHPTGFDPGPETETETEAVGAPGARSEPDPRRRPHKAKRRGRRLVTALLSVFVAVVLVLAGVGLGTLGASVIGLSKLADLQKQAPPGAPPGGPGSPQGGPDKAQDKVQAPDAAGKGAADPSHTEPQGGKGQAPAPTARATVGVEAVDAPGGAGARVVGVHIPGPGHSAGLVRGDVLLALGDTRVKSAAHFAAAVQDARPGTPIGLHVRHAGGDRQTLTITPGVVI